MNTTFNVGIDLLTHQWGELPSGVPYVLTGEPGTGKTTFALQFLYRGLRDRHVGIFVSTQAPERVVAHARDMGMDLAPFLKDGTLQMYEIARKDAYTATDFFEELKHVTAGYPTGRFALEMALPPIAAGQEGAWTEELVSFLRKLEAMKTTAFMTFEPEAPAFMRDALMHAAGGVFVLKLTADTRTHLFAIKKMPSGHTQAGEFSFKIEPGQGVVEPTSAKSQGISFPRYND